MRGTDGEQLWERPFETNITSLLVENINERGDPEIIVGTQDGRIFAYTTTNTELWDRSLVADGEAGAPVTRLLKIENLETGQPILIAASQNVLYTVQIRASFLPTPIAVYDAPINDVFRLNQPG